MLPFWSHDPGSRKSNVQNWLFYVMEIKAKTQMQLTPGLTHSCVPPRLVPACFLGSLVRFSAKSGSLWQCQQ